MSNHNTSAIKPLFVDTTKDITRVPPSTASPLTNPTTPSYQSLASPLTNLNQSQQLQQLYALRSRLILTPTTPNHANYTHNLNGSLHSTGSSPSANQNINTLTTRFSQDVNYSPYRRVRNATLCYLSYNWISV